MAIETILELIKLHEQNSSDLIKVPANRYAYLFLRDDGKLYYKNDSGLEVDISVLSAILRDGGLIKIGTGDNYIGINETSGTTTLSGDATTYQDLLQSLIGQRLESPASDIVQNNAEGTLTFETDATILDYVTMNVQMNHNWKIGSSIYPHIHWFQAEDNIPNWLLAYRWQIQGETKTADWTYLGYDHNVFTYASDTLNQITSWAAIAPPEGAGLSDIVQFRIHRDTANASTKFAGADPYTANVEAVNFDIHYEIDGFGSNEEYTK